MTEFGDYDPDDGWDASDTVPDLLGSLQRRVAWLIDHHDDIAPRVGRIVADIAWIRERVLTGDP